MIVWSCCAYYHAPSAQSIDSWLISRRKVDGLMTQLIPLCRTSKAAIEEYNVGRAHGVRWPFILKVERVP